MTGRRVVLALMLIDLSGNCFAPKPRVVAQKLSPPERNGEPWRLAVTVNNEGRGQGQAEITSRLRNRKGEVVAQEQRSIDLQPHETVTVVIEMRPAWPGPLMASSEVQSPPQ